MNLFLSVLVASVAMAALPPATMILSRTADNSGSGSYTIEQDVQFPNGAESITLHESWVIENGQSMRVTVTGLREYKDSVKFQILYAGGQRWTLQNGRRESSHLPVDFAERFCHWRTLENAQQQLISLKMAPAA